MAHTLASEKGPTPRDTDEQELSIIDPVQEQEIIERRALLSQQFRPPLGNHFKAFSFSLSTAVAHKRNRGWYVYPLFSQFDTPLFALATLLALHPANFSAN